MAGMRFVLSVVAFSAIAATAHLWAAPAALRKSEPLTQPYRPHTQTLLAEGGKARAVILLPEDESFREVALQVAAELGRRCGTKFPTLPEGDYARRSPEIRTIVVLGNCFTGPLALRLYANKLACSDGFYPGAGLELRTIPDALDTGANVLFIGGSSPAGVRRSAQALYDLLPAGPRVVLERVVKWQCALQGAPTPPDEAAIRAQVQRAKRDLGAFRSDPFRSVCSRLISAARDYYLSGDNRFGRLYAQLAAVLSRHYREKKPDPPTFILPALVMALDQIEESAGLTDADRLTAAEWLRQMVEDTMGYWEMRHPIKRYENHEQGPIWNHETHPALGVAHAAQYLRTHYSVPAAAYWEAVVDNLFAGQVHVDQPLEDSANYQWIVPRHTAAYVLATGRRTEYFTEGAFRQCLEYAIASHDNQGNEATHGDAWQPFGSTAGSLFALGAARYRDPRYLWMLDRLGRSPRPALWAYAGPQGSQEPVKHIGLRLFTTAPERVRAYGIADIPPKRVLDKAVFRSGWQRSDEYLMLDGLNVGNHKHLDANAIIRFTHNRRLWLADMDYIRAAPKYHNSIAVTRDGRAPNQSPASRGDAQVIAEPPLAAELLFSASGAGRALTQSLLADYDGLDWKRSIFWEAMDFFVVIDELTAREPGEYLARCFWRTLGQAKIEGNTLRVTQRGEHRTGNDALVVIEDGGRQVVEFLQPQAQITHSLRLAEGKYGVALIARGLNGGSDSLFLRLDEGQPVAYHLPLDKYAQSSGNWEKTSPAPPLVVPQTGRHVLTISLREGPGVKLDKLVLVPPKGEPLTLEAEDLVKDQVEVIAEPEQHFVIVNADGARLKLTGSFDYGHGSDKGYYAHYPYADKITRVLTQVKAGRLAAGDSFVLANLFRTSQGADPLRVDLQPLREGAWVVGGASKGLVGLGSQSVPGGRIDAALFLLTPRGLVAAGARRIALLDARWDSDTPCSVSVDFVAHTVEPEDRRQALAALAKLRPDRVAAVLDKLRSQARPAPPPAPVIRPKAPTIDVAWSQRLPAPVTALATDKELILAGAEAGQIALLDARGKIRWQRELKSRVRSVAFAHLTGDQIACLVGTHDGHVRALRAASGEPLWSYACEPYHGRSGSVGTLFAADLDGDGSDEVVAGSDNWHYHGLSSGGKLLWRTETVHASTVGCAADLTGDGRDDVVAGTEYYWPRLLDSTGRQIGRFSGGPVTTAVAAFDLDGDGKAEPVIGMDDCFVRLAQVRGGFVWSANVGGSPTAIRPLDVTGDGQPEVICASEAFGVYALSAQGKQLWRAQLPEAVTGLAVVGDRLTAACDDGRVYVLDRRGEIVAQCKLPGRPVAVCALGPQGFVAAADATLTAAVLGP